MTASKFMDSIAELPSRFWDKVAFGPGCWLWQAHKVNGYGCFKIDGLSQQAHRLSYAWARGPIAEGLHVMHSCDVRGCVNYLHLSLGTCADNMRDRNEKGRQARGESQHLSKLKKEDVFRIRGNEENWRASEWARFFGVAHSTIRRVIVGDTWSHV